MTEFFCVSPEEDKLELSQDTFLVSPHYNQKTDGTAVTCKKTGNGVFGMMTVIVCHDKGEASQKAGAEYAPVMSAMAGKPLSAHQADGVKIQAGGHSWKIVNAHVEAGATCEYIGIDGCYGLGRVMAAMDEETDMTVVKW